MRIAQALVQPIFSPLLVSVTKVIYEVFCFLTRCVLITPPVFADSIPFGSWNDTRVMFAIINGQRPPRPSTSLPSASSCNNAVWALIEQCWDQVPSNRPLAASIVMRLALAALLAGNVTHRHQHIWSTSFIERAPSSLKGHPFGPLDPDRSEPKRQEKHRETRVTRPLTDPTRYKPLADL
jgi:hypothetical protein